MCSLRKRKDDEDMNRRVKRYKTKVVTVIFVEGDADELIIRRLLDYYRESGWCCEGDLEIVNSNGFPTEIKMTSKLKQIESRSEDVVIQFKTVCCEYDSDVFELQYQQRPDWEKIEGHLREKFGVSDFCRIEARTSIEDWMLDDLDGLLNALGLSQNTKPKGKYGQEKVSDLFVKKNIVYNRQKGRNSIQKYIDKLDIAKIREARKKELKDFEKLLGVDLYFK